VLHSHAVPGLRSADEVGGGDSGLPEQLLELGRDPITQLDWGQTRSGGRLLNLQAVLVRTGGESRGGGARHSQATVPAQGVRQ
jgi:hypothetical protein